MLPGKKVMEYAESIKASPLFHSFNTEEIRVIMECMNAQVRTYHKGEIILLSDETVRYIGVVLSGTVHMVKENTMGDRILLSIIRSGELFGESFVCGDDAISYTTFQVMDTADILFLPFQKVMHACSNTCPYHHTMTENMVTMLANKNVRLMEKIDVSSQKTLREKILTFLRLQSRHQNSNTVEINVNRTILAEYLGVNRSALTRELALLKEEGILDFEKNRFFLPEK